MDLQFGRFQIREQERQLKYMYVEPVVLPSFKLILSSLWPQHAAERDVRSFVGIRETLHALRSLFNVSSIMSVSHFLIILFNLCILSISLFKKR